MKKIIHIDMDAFYAAVEQRDNPAMRNKPVVVGGNPQSRGVVCTASYEARKYGIHSAMATAKAFKLCPQAIFIKPRMNVYREISKQLRNIFYRYTKKIEPLSLDEAYLDVTENLYNCPSATIIAQHILYNINKETGLTASGGVSFNKFLAKVASDVNKPSGLTVITPNIARDFMFKLPIEKFYGIGKKTATKLRLLNIKNGKDLYKFSKEELITKFGKAGLFYYNIVRGVDDREVITSRVRKSLGRESTFHEDIKQRAELLEVLKEIAREVSCEMKKNHLKGKSLILKVKYADFSQVTRSHSEKEAFNDFEKMFLLAEQLLNRTKAGEKAVRLLGLSFCNLDNIRDNGQSLFYQPELPLPF